MLSIPLLNTNTIALQVELLLLAIEEAPNLYYFNKWHGNIYFHEIVELYEKDMVVNYIGSYILMTVPRKSINLIQLKQKNKNQIFKLLKDYYLQTHLFRDWNQVRFYFHSISNQIHRK